MMKCKMLAQKKNDGNMLIAFEENLGIIKLTTRRYTAAPTPTV